MRFKHRNLYLNLYLISLHQLIQLEYRQQHRHDDKTDRQPHGKDHYRLKQSHETGCRGIKLPLESTPGLVQHGIQRAALFADADQMDQQRREKRAAGKSGRKFPPFDQLRFGFSQKNPVGPVDHRFGSYLHCPDDRHAAGEKQPQYLGKTGEDQFLQERSKQRQLQQESVPPQSEPARSSSGGGR